MEVCGSTQLYIYIMKPIRWFTRSNPLLSYLRVAVAGTLVLAAVALASVALKTASPSLLGKSDQQNKAINKFRQDRDQLLGNKIARPGPELRLGGPFAAAEEDYANRAYPAVDVPLAATVNALPAFNQVNSRSAVKGKNAKNAPAQWTLIGPSSANFPPVLTFAGTPYTTSGRITALAIAPNCGQGHCYLYVAAAGGGIWRTDKALHTNPSQRWDFISGSFATNAIGALIIDPTDPTGNTLYAGTGEPNASADSEAGLGLYKSTDGGNTWTLLPAVTTTSISGAYTGNAFLNRAISAIAVDPTNPSVLYVSSASAIRGVASVLNGADAAPPVPLPGRGVYKTTDGGATFTLLNSATSGLPFVLRGATDVKLDPTNHNTIYAALFIQGVFRSTNGGANWTQIFAPTVGNFIERDGIAVAALPNGHTRMYLGAGSEQETLASLGGNPFLAQFYRSDQVESGSPTFTNMTTGQNVDYCTGQCWYDNVVYSPPGKSNVVYLGGSFDYNHYGFRNNGRAFIYSTDGGANFTDMTWDATTNPAPAGSCCQPNPIAPHGMHPDSHAIVEVPGTDAAFFGGDGGLTRSSGTFTDISSQCDSRPLGAVSLALCHQLLSRVPTQLFTTYNDGLSTLQFQSVSVNPLDPTNVQGGTQDNGTFQTTGSNTVWPQIIYGDGGQSGFNAANPTLRLNSFTGQFNDVNFHNGDPTKWVIATGPIVSSPESSYFYTPVIADPNPGAAGTIFQGSNSVWRTQDWAGNQVFLEANCPEFTTNGATPTCGDFVPIGPTNATDLTDSGIYGPPVYGSDRRFAFMAAIARAPQNTGTIWAATGTGRVFYSGNADASASSVVWERLDLSSTVDPNRFVTGIYVDPTNPNHAWISYSGFNVNTPTTPGHVFEVTRTGPSTANWTRIDGGAGGLPDLPVTGIVRDDPTGDIYVSNDFGVLRLPFGSTTWVQAASGLPMVEVCGLTISTSGRKLFAATHGRSAWSLALP